MEVRDPNDKLIEVTGLTTGNEVNIFMRKINAFPPIRTDLNHYYYCKNAV